MSGRLLTGDRGRSISICVWFLPPPPPPHSGLTRQPQTTTILLHCRQETRVFIDLSLSFVIMNPTKQRVIKLGSSVSVSEELLSTLTLLTLVHAPWTLLPLAASPIFSYLTFIQMNTNCCAVWIWYSTLV